LSSFGGHGWDALELVVDALSSVGDDKAAIRDYLEKKQEFVGQHGIFNFSPDDHNGLTKAAFSMVVVKDNDWALVD
jgi:branched-chain amino acid transport system substrate-binding protein